MTVVYLIVAKRENLRRLMQGSCPSTQSFVLLLLVDMDNLRLAAQNSLEHHLTTSRYAESFAKRRMTSLGYEFAEGPWCACDSQLCSKRPISPDLVGVDFKPTPWLFHYKLPLAAVSSIANRGTGLALTGVATYGSYVALTGDLPAAIEAMKVGYCSIAD